MAGKQKGTERGLVSLGLARQREKEKGLESGVGSAVGWALGLALERTWGRSHKLRAALPPTRNRRPCSGMRFARLSQ